VGLHLAAAIPKHLLVARELVVKVEMLVQLSVVLLPVGVVELLPQEWTLVQTNLLLVVLAMFKVTILLFWLVFLLQLVEPTEEILLPVLLLLSELEVAVL
jgi:hypothetical protein